MALIKCPECNNTVSDQAITCPHCGYPIQKIVAEDYFYDIVITKLGNKNDKKGTVTYLYETMGLSLPEVVNIVENPPQIAFTDLSKDAANEIAAKLSSLNNTVQVQQHNNVNNVIVDRRCPNEQKENASGAEQPVENHSKQESEAQNKADTPSNKSLFQPLSQNESVDVMNNAIKKTRSRRTAYIAETIICFLFLIVLFVLNEDSDYSGFIVFFVLLGAIGLIGAIVTSNNIAQAEKDLELAKTDFAQYEKAFEEKRQQAIEQIKRINDSKPEQPPLPMCPNCGSKRTKRITTTNRMLSVGMVGLASSKIGKQYECLNCKHKW